MGLVVTELSLADFRSFERLSVRLSPGVSVFCGPNAAGKTNTVEALQLLTSGQSFRRPDKHCPGKPPAAKTQGWRKKHASLCCRD